MIHRNKNKKLNRDTKSRKALFKGLIRSLVEHGVVTTTEVKAKLLKQLADKVIHRAQVDSIANRRLLHKFFGRRDVVNTLVERIAPEFTDRTSGFTTIKKADLRRGDNTQMLEVSLIKMPKDMGSLKKPQSSVEPVAKAKKVVSQKVSKKSVEAK